MFGSGIQLYSFQKSNILALALVENLCRVVDIYGGVCGTALFSWKLRTSVLYNIGGCAFDWKGLISTP